MNNLDNEGYPTQELIQYILDYRPETPIMEFVETIRDSWMHGDFGFKLHKQYRGTRKLELHTCGWSGNEEIVEAILDNAYLTHLSMKYVKWTVGGHYYFEIPLNK